MRVVRHGGVTVLVPRSSDAPFEIERARKERELFRELAMLPRLSHEGIARVASARGPLGRLPRMSPAQVESFRTVVRREASARASVLSDDGVISTTGLVKAIDEAMRRSNTTVRGLAVPDPQATHLAAAVLLEPVFMLAIEAFEVALRALWRWDPSEGPARFQLRIADVMRDRAGYFQQLCDETGLDEHRQLALLLNEISNAQREGVEHMPVASMEVRRALVALKEQVMRLPEPSMSGWGSTSVVPEDASFEGNTAGLMMRLVVELWRGFRDPTGSGGILGAARSFMSSLIWIILPIATTPLEEMPEWTICLHERVEDWIDFGRECAAWTNAIDSLRGYQARPSPALAARLEAALATLVARLRPVLGPGAGLASAMANTPAASAESTLEQLIELRVESAGLSAPSGGRVLGTEGRALWSIRQSLTRRAPPRHCATEGCPNLLPEDAAAQKKRCESCIRAQTLRRVHSLRARERRGAGGKRHHRRAAPADPQHRA